MAEPPLPLPSMYAGPHAANRAGADRADRCREGCAQVGVSRHSRLWVNGQWEDPRQGGGRSGSGARSRPRRGGRGPFRPRQAPHLRPRIDRTWPAALRSSCCAAAIMVSRGGGIISPSAAIRRNSSSRSMTSSTRPNPTVAFSHVSDSQRPRLAVPKRVESPFSFGRQLCPADLAVLKFHFNNCTHGGKTAQVEVSRYSLGDRLAEAFRLPRDFQHLGHLGHLGCQGIIAALLCSARSQRSTSSFSGLRLPWVCTASSHPRASVRVAASPRTIVPSERTARVLDRAGYVRLVVGHRLGSRGRWWRLLVSSGCGGTRSVARCGMTGRTRAGVAASAVGPDAVWLQYTPWRVSCARCGVKVRAGAVADGSSVFTAAGEELAAYLAQVTDPTTVSRLLGIPPDEHVALSAGSASSCRVPAGRRVRRRRSHGEAKSWHSRRLSGV